MRTKPILTALFIRMPLAAVLMLPALGAQAGVVFTILHSFQDFPNGANPYAGLAQGSDGNFYGTTYYGGTNGGNGAVFQISSNGTFTSLYSFTGGNDGANPQAALMQGSDGSFYGTTSEGGTNGEGTVFQMSADGALTSLYSFTNGVDGANPQAGLVQGSDGNFYGTAYSGGAYGWGTVFKISTRGNLTSLYSFTGANDGGYPLATLVQGGDGNFYGTTEVEGSNSYGTVFQIGTNGALTTLYAFGTVTNADGDPLDGASPEAGLVRGSDGNFYGTTYGGGSSFYGWGTMFKISTKGALTTLYSFGAILDVNDYPLDGAYPEGSLVQGSDGNLYGTTSSGGTNGYDGTVFQMTTDGALISSYSFTGNNGANPLAGLVQGSDGNLHGTTYHGGATGNGTVFQISAKGALTGSYPFTGALDGANPDAAMAQGSDGNFYGTTYAGGALGEGTVFRISAAGALTSLYSFTGGDDGGNPQSDLVQDSNGNFYGTTHYGGMENSGTVFQVSTAGALTNLYSFVGVGEYGASPLAGLALGRDGNFYGTTADGGDSDLGTVFQISTNAAQFSSYSIIDTNDGASPQAGLVLASDGNFYGTTYAYGTNGFGTVFRVSASGALTGMYSFTNGVDGANPEAGLVQGADGYLYGTTVYGGTNNDGTVFKISTNGVPAAFYDFGTVTDTNGDPLDGANPEAGLVQGADGNFYGTTYGGGAYGWGTLFKISTSGNLTSLYSFSGGNDGAYPQAGLVQGSDGSFYGTTLNGGLGGSGIVFRLSLAGSTAPEFQSVTLNKTTLSLTWSAEPGAMYQLQYNSRLSSNGWSNLGGTLTAAGVTLNTTDSITNTPQRFYRVLLLP
jgi:uncharacterized repeat protein (TIGR03803 family)